ncbi:unnamed protein product, partial [Durusdinium trenchii]
MKACTNSNRNQNVLSMGAMPTHPMFCSMESRDRDCRTCTIGVLSVPGTSGQLKPHTAPAMPRRPRVPPAPRRRILATRPAPKSIEPHEAEQKRRPSTVATGSEVRKRWEPQPCPWCGELEPPTHPKQCKLRLVECKHCKQKMELGSLRLHFKGCAARPMVQPPRSTKAGSGFLTLHRLQSTAQQLSRQLQDVLARFVGQLPEPEQ